MPSASSARGFTLFELLIVIALIAIMYGIFVQKISPKQALKEERFSLKTLKRMLLKNDFNQKIEFVCYEPCDKCQIFIDGKAATKDEIALFESPVRVYKPDKYGQLISVEYLPRMQKKDEKLRNVCFEYAIYNNRAGSNIGVAYAGKFYGLSAYMDDVKEFDSLSDLGKFFDMTALLPQDRLDYDH